MIMPNICKRMLVLYYNNHFCEIPQPTDVRALVIVIRTF